MASIKVENARKQNQFSWPSALLVVLAVLIIAGIAIPGCPLLFLDTRRVKRKHEIHLMKQATESFQTYFGHSIPGRSTDEIRQHLLAIDPEFDFDELNLDELSNLDDAERLVFWLGGDFPHADEKHDHPIFIEFERSRLVDRDGDGFSEYETETDGLIFQFDSDTKRISCDFSNEELTVDINRELTAGEIHAETTK